MVTDYEAKVDAEHVPSTATANWRVEHLSRSSKPVAHGVRRFDSGTRIAVIGTMLAERARMRLRCVGGKGRRRAAVVEVVGE